MNQQFWCGRGRPHATGAGRDACQMETHPCKQADQEVTLLAQALGADVVTDLGPGTHDPHALGAWFDLRQQTLKGLVRRGSTIRSMECPLCGARWTRKFSGAWLPNCDCRPECVFCADADGTVEMRPVTKRTQAMLCARCGEDELALTTLAREDD